MRPKATNGERILLLTLTLEAAIVAEDWTEVNQLFGIRSSMIEEADAIPEALVTEIGAVEERMLTNLRHRLGAVRSDLRNLTAALRIAAPYSRIERPSSLSLAG